MRLTKILLGLVSLITLAAGPAVAQDWLGSLANPVLGRAQYSASYRFSHLAESDVRNRTGELGWSDNRARLIGPIWQDESHELTFNLDFRELVLTGSAVLPLTQAAFPGQLYDIDLGATYRSRFKNGWIGGLHLDFGSAGDKPFATWDETAYGATVFVRIPDGPTNAWILLLNAANRRDFLEHVPIPGLGYWYQPSQRFMGLIGLPVMWLTWRPSDQLSLTLFYAMIRQGRLQADLHLNRVFTLYAAFESVGDNFFLADRDDKDRQLFYYDLRTRAGLEVNLNRRFNLDLSAGYVFDRFFFEGKGYTDWDNERVGLEGSWLVSAKVEVKW